MKELYVKSVITIMLLSIGLLVTCNEQSTEPDEDQYRYKYPHYSNGYVSFHHSEYGHDCDDDAYWSGEVRSKDFDISDSLFLTITEELGLKQEIPYLTLKETVLLECSNGDVEEVIFNLPFPPCNTQLNGFLPLFGSIKSKKGVIEKNNGFIDVQSGSVLVFAKYKSYWTGKVVVDTAYVFL